MSASPTPIAMSSCGTNALSANRAPGHRRRSCRSRVVDRRVLPSIRSPPTAQSCQRPPRPDGQRARPRADSSTCAVVVVVRRALAGEDSRGGSPSSSVSVSVVLPHRGRRRVEQRARRSRRVQRGAGAAHADLAPCCRARRRRTARSRSRVSVIGPSAPDRRPAGRGATSANDPDAGRPHDPIIPSQLSCAADARAAMTARGDLAPRASSQPDVRRSSSALSLAAVPFKRRFVAPGDRARASSRSSRSATRCGSRSISASSAPSTLLRTALPVARRGVRRVARRDHAVAVAAVAARSWRAAAASSVNKELAARAYRITLKGPVRVLLLRTGVWAGAAALTGLFLHIYERLAAAARRRADRARGGPRVHRVVRARGVVGADPRRGAQPAVRGRLAAQAVRRQPLPAVHAGRDDRRRRRARARRPRSPTTSCRSRASSTSSSRPTSRSRR